MSRASSVERLVARLQAIPEGEIAATARRAGMNPRHLRRLREGKNADVQLSTLERLAVGLREPLGWVIDEGATPPPTPTPQPKKLDGRPLRRLLRDVEKLALDARAVAALVEPEE
jgi:transcriptional regulator with XRE-family HTH domain